MVSLLQFIARDHKGYHTESQRLWPLQYILLQETINNVETQNHSRDHQQR